MMSDPTARPRTEAGPPADAAAAAGAAGGPAFPKAGATVGRYRITAETPAPARAAGAGAAVERTYSAEDAGAGRAVSLRLIATSAFCGPGGAADALREALAATRVSHPNAAAVLDAGEAGAFLYVAAEPVKGLSAGELVARTGPMDWRRACRVVADVCRALSAAHDAGVVHGRLDPDAVVCRPDGSARLRGFGPAVPVPVPASGSASGFAGGAAACGAWPEYTTPEGCQGEPVDARGDLYRLGCVMFHLIAGRPPFPAPDPEQAVYAHVYGAVPDLREARPEVPPAVAAVAARAMAKTPAERFASAAEMLSALEAAAPAPPSTGTAAVPSITPTPATATATATPAPAATPLPPPAPSSPPAPTVPVKAVPAAAPVAAVPVATSAPSAPSAPVAAVQPVQAVPVTPKRPSRGAAPPPPAPTAAPPTAPAPTAKAPEAKNSAEAKAADELYQKGYRHLLGQGVPQDDAEAAKWFKQAAAKGHAAAMNNLGCLHQGGRGVPQDHAEARRLYRAAAEAGDPSACNNLGLLFRHGLGTPKDDGEAAKWFRLAAERGDRFGQNNIAWCYRHGLGVNRDEAAALFWYLMSARQGDPLGQSCAGRMYEKGRGTPADERRAVEWYRRAARKGHPHGQYHLARMTETGRGGLSPDPVTARGLYSAAAEQGHDGAKAALARLDAAGIGVSGRPSAAPEAAAGALSASRIPTVGPADDDDDADEQAERTVTQQTAIRLSELDSRRPDTTGGSVDGSAVPGPSDPALTGYDENGVRTVKVSEIEFEKFREQLRAGLARRPKSNG
jgi:TPR repeat protein